MSFIATYFNFVCIFAVAKIVLNAELVVWTD